MNNPRIGKWEHFFLWSRRSVRRLTLATLVTCAIGANVNSYAIDFDQGEVVNLGSGFAVPIINNDGQLPESVLFVAPGPTGNTAYFYNNASIGLALRGYDNQENSFTTISHVGANVTAEFEPGNSRASHTNYFSGNSISLPTNIDNYNDVILNNLYDGISARFEVSGRQLISHYEVEANSTTAEIRLNFEDISEAIVNDRTGDVEITLLSGRSAQLHAARVSVGGGELTYVPFSYDGEDVVLDMSAFTGPENVSITVKLTFGPYYHDYYAVADENGEIVAVSTAFNTMMDGADNSDADVIITRLNTEGTEVLSTTILAGEDEDVGYSLALTDAAAGPCGNRLFAVGSTRSNQFPVEGERMGATEAFVVRLNNNATTVESGRLISAAGRDVAHHIIICGCNVYIVGATDGGLADIARDEMTFTTVFPSVEASDKVQNYYLAKLDANLTSVENRMTVVGPIMTAPLRAVCQGGSVEIGVENGGVTTAECTSPSNDISQMANWVTSPCDGSTGQAGMPFWGLHALCWKKERWPWLTLNPSSCSAPIVTVEAGDEQDLNNLEASSACCNPNPPGSWQLNHYNQFGNTKEERAVELLLGAAFYHKKFDSPVYANWLTDPPGSDPVMEFALLIHRVKMHITDNANNPSTLQSVCSSFYNNAQSGDEFDVDCLQGLTGHLIFCSVGVVNWHLWTTPINNYPTNIEWDGKTFVENLSDKGIYIADPPEDEPHAAWFIQEMARQLSHSVTAVTNVEKVTYTDGEAEESTTEARQIRMVAFPSPGSAVALPTAVEEQKDDPFTVSTMFGMITNRPNPASGEISVSYQVRDAAFLRLELYNVMGQKVGILDSGYRHPHQYTVSYDVSNLAAGMYYLRLSSDSDALSIPLMIVH